MPRSTRIQDIVLHSVNKKQFQFVFNLQTNYHTFSSSSQLIAQKK